jgi:pimeloyl-ACP methyl ester carboxylesterase
MTILRMYADPALREGFGDVLSRVNRLVLLAPVDVAVEKLHPDFLAIAETSGLLIEVGSLLGIVTETCAAAMRGGGNDPDGVPVEEADKLADVMRNGATRRAAQAMILQAVPFVPKEGKLRPDWDRIDAIVAGYANVKVPALILWGRRDETFPVSMGFKLAAELPDARLRVLPLTMHSPTWERPRVCTTLIREFIQADGRTSPRVAEVDLRSYDAVASAGGAN